MEKVFKIKRGTHIQEMRNLYESQLQEVCELLNWTPQQYCWHQYREYERFVHQVTLYAQTYEFKDRIRHSATFRGFWNNEWEQRNRNEFINDAYYNTDNKKQMADDYLRLHKAERLLEDELFYGRFEAILKYL